MKGLGLDVPDWGDDAPSFAAPAHFMPKQQATKKSSKIKSQAAPAVPAPGAGKQGNGTKRKAADFESASTAPPAHKMPHNAKSKEESKRKHNEDVTLVAAEASTHAAECGGEEAKKKKKKGKQNKNKSGATQPLANSAGQPQILQHKTARKQQQQPAPKQDPVDTDGGRASRGEQSESGQMSKKAKKRKRNNKFRDDGPSPHHRGAGAEVSMPSAKKHKAQSHHPAPVESGNKTSQDKKASNTPPPPTSKHLPTSHTTKSQGARAREKEKTAEEEKNQDTHEGEQDVDVDAKFPLKNMAPVGSNRRLTPLQAKLAAKLQGAHFRMLNEELYTTPSSSAVALFKQDPSLFDTYHQGFRSQTTKWPVNPVNVMLKYLNKHPSWIIADLGCGDAKIAQNLGKARVHSFDLVSVNDLVTACDIAHVPLADQAVDAVVLSLALMGTNYASFLCEANRIVKLKGKVLVAEVRSRCEHVLDRFIALLNAIGFTVDQVDKDNKMFIMFYLTKVATCASRAIKHLDAPPLKACQYKKR